MKCEPHLPMKNKTQFKIGDAVKSPVNVGTVQLVHEFSDHTEYLVEWPDKTASWVHERNLSPNSKLQTPSS